MWQEQIEQLHRKRGSVKRRKEKREEMERGWTPPTGDYDTRFGQNTFNICKT